MLTYKGFRFIRAEDKELKEKIFRLRYETYVEEFGFEKVTDHPHGLETDIYDPESIHFACLDGQDHVVGTIRLIMHSEKGFPIEDTIKDFPDEKKPPPDKIAEVSRLAVSKGYRRRRGDGMFGLGGYLKESEGGILPDRVPPGTECDKRKRPIILLGLFEVMYHESKRMGLTHWYMITEERVFRVFEKFGFLFYKIGEPVEYHGIRTPYLGVISDMEQRLVKNNPRFLKLVLRGLEKEYWPKFD